MNFEPPRSLGTVVECNLVGMLFPWRAGQPALFSMGGSDLRYLPLFEDRAQLDAIHDFVDGGFDFDSVKQVMGMDFLESFRGTDVRLITNLHIVNDKLRWAQIPTDLGVH